MDCPSCGADVSGNFCSHCGSPLSEGVRACSKCGAKLKPEALFCSECGQPAGPPVRKPISSHIPWVLSVVFLAAFSLAIAYFVQRSSRARVGDDPITGGVPTGESGVSPREGMPPDLGSMTPREAADRLFERSMREQEAGNEQQAVFFANMGLQAYGRIPPGELDLDAVFHVGLLHLAIGDPATARTIAETVLEGDANHLLALVLARQAAHAAGDSGAAAEYAERLRAGVEAGELDRRPEYESHRALIEREM